MLSSPANGPCTVQVLLDGHRIPSADAGADVHDGVVTVRRQRLYSAGLPPPTTSATSSALRFADGVTGYAFTFG